MSDDLTRRTLIIGTVGLAAAACGSGDDAEPGSTGSPPSAPETTTTTSGTATTIPSTIADVDLPSDPFRLGVASGEPLPDAVVLWTRLAPEPTEVGGGMPGDDAVDVGWQVASDERFADVVAEGSAVAEGRYAHSVHVDATGLAPATDYFYRFTVADFSSPVGLTRTLRDRGSDPYRFALTTCQDFQWGEYGAWRSIADRDDLDAVVFTGDYIYELPPGDLSPDQSGRRVWATPPPSTIDEFRTRYAQTKADASLQAAHHAMPWFVMWDDHEITDNYWRDGVGQIDPIGGDFAARRTAAYQAWWEHQPVRFEPPVDGRLDVHRAVQVGDLAQLLLIDTRQHADVPPCRDTSVLDAGEGCDQRLDPERTLLGAEQETWLLDAVASASTEWNVLVSPSMFAGLDISAEGSDTPAYYLEAWDGYPAARQRLADALRGAEAAPVVLSGDYHASFVLDVGPGFDDEPLCPEFMTPAISSVPFVEDHTAGNPHAQYFDPVNGYVVCTLTSDECQADWVALADVWDPASPTAQVASYRVGRGEAVATPIVG
ncbi:MAG: alkaline phosphatase [Acidimicrobiales bacterium]